MLKRVKELKWVSVYVALIVMCAGIAVLFGWAIREPLLIQLNPSFAPMQINTALCFVLVAIALLLTVFVKNDRRIIFVAILPGVIAGATLLEYALNINLGIDQIFTDYVILEHVTHPGRMAINTATCFIFLSVALFIKLYTKNTLARLFAQIISIMVLFISLAAISAYVFNFPFGNGWGHYTKMALHTAVGFLLMSPAITISFLIDSSQLKEEKKLYPSLILFFSCAFVFMVIWNGLLSGTNIAIQANLDGMKAQIAQQFKHTVDGELTALSRLTKRWVYQKGMEKDRWLSEAASYIADFEGYSAIVWIDADYMIRWIYPIEQNKKVIGENLSKMPAEKLKMEEAKYEKKMTISQPHEYLGGKAGFVAFSPIFIDGVFGGYISGAFDIEELFNFILSNDFVKNYDLSVSSGKEIAFQTFDASAHTLDDYKVTAEISILDETWTISLWPKIRLIDHYATSAPSVLFLFGLLISLIVSCTWYYFSTYKNLVAEGREMMNSAQAGLLKLTLSGKIQDANDTMCELLGLSKKEIIGRQWLTFVVPEERGAVEFAWTKSILATEDFFSDFKVVKNNADSLWVQCSASMQEYQNESEKCYVATFYDIDFLKEKESRLEALTYKDELTDLPNRRYLNEFLERALYDAKRHERKFSVLYIDIDYFKKINDTLGHAAGDDLLVELGHRFTSILRGEDFVARLGGDEFCMVLYEAADKATVQVVLDRIKEEVSKPMMLASQEVLITLSIGAVVYSGEDITDEDLLARADSALYQAKENGRNNAQFYSD